MPACNIRYRTGDVNLAVRAWRAATRRPDRAALFLGCRGNRRRHRPGRIAFSWPLPSGNAATTPKWPGQAGGRNNTKASRATCAMASSCGRHPRRRTPAMQRGMLGTPSKLWRAAATTSPMARGKPHETGPRTACSHAYERLRSRPHMRHGQRRHGRLHRAMLPRRRSGLRNGPAGTAVSSHAGCATASTCARRQCTSAAGHPTARHAAWYTWYTAQAIAARPSQCGKPNRGATGLDQKTTCLRTCVKGALHKCEQTHMMALGIPMPLALVFPQSHILHTKTDYRSCCHCVCLLSNMVENGVNRWRPACGPQNETTMAARKIQEPTAEEFDLHLSSQPLRPGRCSVPH